MNPIVYTKELKDLLNKESVYIQLSVPQLVEKIVARNEGKLTLNGAISVFTGKYTGRSPRDKYIVDEGTSKGKIEWGPVNQPISEYYFSKLYHKMIDYLTQKEEIFVFNGFAGADQDFQLPLQVINEYAWHNLFAQQIFIRPNEEELKGLNPEFTIICAPNFNADPAVDGTHSETFIIVSFERKTILIGGTEYAGEMKKAIFSVMNNLLPENNVFSMHCSANVGDGGDVALFFGLSGTGKTTLSAHPHRRLIGDDEHGWSPSGVFNIEGGCYAKTINLSYQKEPQIFDAIKFGTILENVMLDNHTRVVDYDDSRLTENTRAAYPLEALNNIVQPSKAGHPKTIIFLTADAFGVLPPISKLTKEQAMYYFLSGYTSKLAGTERGVTAPEATFSACFGEPFLPLHATVYAEMLAQKVFEHNANVFLVNTGWTGGEYGVGKRMKLSYTRAMVDAAIEGKLDQIDTVQDKFFGLNIPVYVPGVPEVILQPHQTWEEQNAYEAKARELADKFRENFKKFTNVSVDVAEKGGPLCYR